MGVRLLVASDEDRSQGKLAVAPDASRSVDWSDAISRHNPRVIASVLALSVPYDRAEELASEAWARLIAKDEAGELVTVSLPGLAITQARFLALTWLKNSRRETSLPDDAQISVGDPERSLIARRDVEIALGVLAGCSPSAQAVFHHLYDDPPASHDAIAKRVGLSVQRVRQIVCEVRAKVRAALEGKS